MGMTIEDCISKLTEILEEATEDENSVCYVTDVDEPTLKTSIDTMRKYQQLQADYESRLKADLKAILVELQIQFEEKGCENMRDCWWLLEEKINSLKEAKDGENND